MNNVRINTDVNGRFITDTTEFFNKTLSGPGIQHL
jgi:hypothetical protein